MNIANYDSRRPLFWGISLIALLVVLHAVLSFVRSGFAHPVSALGDICVKSGIWIAYHSVVRDLREARGQIVDTLAIRVEGSAAICCLLAYVAFLPQLS